jgi:hypothetical protein
MGTITAAKRETTLALHLRSATAGACVWLVATFALGLDWAPALFLFAPLALVPLGLSLLPASEVKVHPGLQLVAALLLVPAFALPPSVLAAGLCMPWLALTGMLALRGLGRLRLPNRFHPAESALTAALLFPVVGAAWLVLSRLGARPLGFSDLIVLATAVHFHYAGFVLPLLIGLATQGRNGWLEKAATFGVIAGVPLVATGITLSTLELHVPEMLAAGWLVLATVLAGVLQLRQSRCTSRSAAVLFVLSSLSLFVAMTLAGMYALGSYLGQPWLEVTEMLPTHGAVNAFGFALLGLLAHHCARRYH